MITKLLIFAGAFLGCLLAMFIDYKKEIKDTKAWIFSIVLSFAVYGIYETLIALGYLPLVLSNLALFGLAIFIGFSLKSLTKKFWEIIRKGTIIVQP